MTEPFLELAIDNKHWFKLPLKLRQRWWTETDFGRQPPSEELKAAVKAAIEGKP